MPNPVETLLSISSAALAVTDPAAVPAGEDARALAALLRRRNGFYAFESALHVFAAGDLTAPGRSLEEWNDPALWKCAYGHLVPEALFFAEDVFGGQFALIGEAVHTFEPETAELAPFADNVEGWAEEVLRRYDFTTGHSVAHAWQAEHGALPAGHRLVPRLPFVVGGRYEAANMVPVEAGRAMRYRGEFARTVAELADGSRFRFNPDDIDGLVCARWNPDKGSDCLCFADP